MKTPAKISPIDPRLVEFASAYLRADREYDKKERDLENNPYQQLMAGNATELLELKAKRVANIYTVHTVLHHWGMPLASFEKALLRVPEVNSLDIQRFWDAIALTENQEKERTPAEHRFNQIATEMISLPSSASPVSASQYERSSKLHPALAAERVPLAAVGKAAA